MTNPAFTQVTFRLRNDDGNETGATWIAAQGADATINVNENFRCRFRIDETASRAWTSKVWNLYYSLNAGAYAAVAASGTPVIFAASSNFTDGEDCTTQLTGGTGTFVTDNNGMKETTGGATNSGTAGYLFEVEFCVQLDGAYVADGDTINLRIYDSTSAIAAYTDTPVITASKIAISKSDSLTIADVAPTMAMVGPKMIDKTDAITVGESHTVSVPLLGGISVSDALSLADTPQVEFPVATLEINRTDTISLGESLLYREDSNPTATDAVTLDESLMYFEDSIWLSEALAVAIGGAEPDRTINVTDALTISESRLIEVPILGGVSVSDAVTLSESLLRMLDMNVSKSDAVTVGETERDVEIPNLGGIGVADVVSLGESRVLTGEMFVSKTDAITVGEIVPPAVVLGAPEPLTIDKTDAVTVGESLARSVDNFISKDDAITVGESLAQSVDNFVNKTDAVTVSEITPPTVVRTDAGQIDISKSDAVNLGESHSVAVPQLGGINVSDAITVGESRTVSEAHNISKTDAVTIGESLARSVDNFVNRSEGVTLGETSDVAASLAGVNVTDGIALTDTPAVSLPELGVFSINVSDAASLGDSFGIAAFLAGVSVSDALSLNESRNVVRQDAGQIDISAIDALNLTDTPSVSLPALAAWTISVSDAVTLGESRTVSRQDADTRVIGVTDSLTLADVLEMLLGMRISVSSGVSLGESRNVTRASNIMKTDALTIGESFTVYAPPEIIINLATGTISLVASQSSVVPGAVTVTLANGALTLSGPPADIIGIFVWLVSMEFSFASRDADFENLSRAVEWDFDVLDAEFELVQ